MSEERARKWRFYLQDMIDFGENVVAYTEGMTQEAFVASGLHFDATELLPRLRAIAELR